MNAQFIIYAKQLAAIGNKIKGISDLKAAKPKNYEEAAAFAASCRTGIIKIRTIIQDMQKVNPPEAVKSEHRKLIEKLKTFLTGMEMVTGSINPTNKTYHERTYLSGLSLMEDGKNDAVSTATDIGNLLKKRLLF